MPFHFSISKSISGRTPTRRMHVAEMERLIQARTLNVDENKMNMQCVRLLDHLQRQLEARHAEHDSKVKGCLETAKHASAELCTAKDGYDARVIQKENHLAEIAHNECVAMEARLAIPQHEVEIVQREEDLARAKRQNDFFSDHLKQIPVVSLRIDVSKQVGRFGFSNHEIRTCVFFPKEVEGADSDSGSPVILVVGAEDEPDDASVKQHMSDDGKSLIPPNIERAAEFTADVVWYNSKKNLKNETMLKAIKVELDRETGLHTVEVTSQRKFKVLIYTKIDFHETPAARSIIDHYAAESRTAQQVLDRIKDDKKRSEDTITAADANVAQHRSDLKSEQVGLEESKKACSASELRFQAAKDKAQEAIQAVEDDYESMRISENVHASGSSRYPTGQNQPTLIKQIAQIFKDNRLDTPLQDDIDKYKTSCNELRSLVQAARENLDDMSRTVVPEDEPPRSVRELGVVPQPEPEPEPEPY